MIGVNYLAILVSAVVAFMLSSAWYTLFGDERMKLLGLGPDAIAAMQRPPAWKPLSEVLRTVVIAFAFARILSLGGAADWALAAQLGALVWVAFPATILLGSVIWENVPWGLAAIHAGDWLLKLLVVVVIVGTWR